MRLNFSRYAELAKVESQSDGTIKVWGYASSGSVDADGETITPEAMKAALPDYMKFGAVRDMHQSNAVGTAIEASVEADGRTFFGAHVVDPVAVKKVQAKVFKGFSIGGKITSRDKLDKSIISGIKLIEVSLVDRPANPEAVFTMYKAEGVEEGAEADPVLESAVVDAPPLPAADEPAVTKVDDPETNAVAGIADLLNKGTLAPSKLLALAHEAVEKAAAPPVEPARISKGMGDLSRFAMLLKQIGWMVTDTNMESMWEGDNSPVPAALNEWLATGLGIFQSMADEEAAELLTYTAPPEAVKAEAPAAEAADSPATPASDGIAPPAVAGDQVPISAATMNSVVSPDVVTVTAADTAVDVTKAEAPGAGDILREAVEKADASLKSELAKRDDEIAILKQQMATVLAQPMPAKGVLNAVAVEKSGDTGGGIEPAGMSPIFKDDGTVDEAATLLKVVHRAGGRPIRF